MLKKTKSKSVSKMTESRSKKSIKSDNLQTSLSPPDSSKHKRNSKRRSNVESSKSRNISGAGKPNEITAQLPKDAAVHFGHFYGLRENASKLYDERNNIGKKFDTERSAPRTEFTRQMLRRLELSAGTKDYARQLSALLEETLEPANFKLDPPPAECTIPEGRQNPSGYPLWYKEPPGTTLTANESGKLLARKYERDRFHSRRANEASSSEESSVVEDSEAGSEPEEDENENEDRYTVSSELIEKNENESSNSVASSSSIFTSEATSRFSESDSDKETSSDAS